VVASQATTATILKREKGKPAVADGRARETPMALGQQARPTQPFDNTHREEPPN